MLSFVTTNDYPAEALSLYLNEGLEIFLSELYGWTDFEERFILASLICSLY